MTASRELAEYIAEALAPLGNISCKRMFGGIGFCYYGVMFAILNRNNELCIKFAESLPAGLGTCLVSRRRDKASGGVKEVNLPYFRLPEAVLDNDDELRAWARLAIARLA